MKHWYCMARPIKNPGKTSKHPNLKKDTYIKIRKTGWWASWYSHSRSLHLPLCTSEQLVAIQAKKPPSLGAWKTTPWWKPVGFEGMQLDVTLMQLLEISFQLTPCLQLLRDFLVKAMISGTPWRIWRERWPEDPAAFLAEEKGHRRGTLTRSSNRAIAATKSAKINEAPGWKTCCSFFFPDLDVSWFLFFILAHTQKRPVFSHLQGICFRRSL